MPLPKPERQRMNTDELRAFTEMQTTLQMYSQTTSKALDAINTNITNLQNRLDRMDSRWDERIRVVEASAIECREKVKTNEDDISDLQKHSDVRDWFLGVLTMVGSVVGMFINPRP